VVTPADRREVVQYLQTTHDLSERRACRLMDCPRNTARAQATRPNAATIQARLCELAQQRPRFGYRRLGVLLRQDGLVVNHKRVYRLYRDAALQVGNRRAGRTRRRRATPRQPLPQAQQANAQWTLDFMHDSLASGRTFRTLNVVDICTRECLAIEVDTSLGGQRVVRVLERIAEQRGYPQVLRIDNGPEFRGSAVATWAAQHGVELVFTAPGKPTHNGYIESFNGKLRDECLNMQWFLSLAEARDVLEAWRDDYNWQRPHSALGQVPPAIYAQRLAAEAGLAL
jgi:putative transposase